MVRALIVNIDGGRIIVSELLRDPLLKDPGERKFILELHRDVTTMGSPRQTFDVAFCELSHGIAKSLREAMIEICKTDESIVHEGIVRERGGSVEGMRGR